MLCMFCFFKYSHISKIKCTSSDSVIILFVSLSISGPAGCDWVQRDEKIHLCSGDSRYNVNSDSCLWISCFFSMMHSDLYFLCPTTVVHSLVD